MEKSLLYYTPKRKFSHNSSLEESPEEKRIKESTSPDAATSMDKGEVMAASKSTEGFGEKLDLILARLSSLDMKMEDLNSTVESLESKIYQMETKIDSVKSKHKKLDEKFMQMETNATLVDEHIVELNRKLEKRKDELDDCRQKMLYLEAYSRRENLKFEGIAEAPQDNAASSPSEATKDVLVDFLEKVLEIEVYLARNWIENFGGVFSISTSSTAFTLKFLVLLVWLFCKYSTIRPSQLFSDHYLNSVILSTLIQFTHTNKHCSVKKLLV